jgi:hypothetical protein
LVGILSYWFRFYLACCIVMFLCSGVCVFIMICQKSMLLIFRQFTCFLRLTRTTWIRTLLSWSYLAKSVMRSHLWFQIAVTVALIPQTITYCSKMQANVINTPRIVVAMPLRKPLRPLYRGSQFRTMHWLWHEALNFVLYVQFNCSLG